MTTQGAVTSTRTPPYSVAGVHSWHDGRLDDRQDALARSWLPGLRLRADMSWGPAGTVVLDADSDRGRVVIKAGTASNHHIDREIAAFRGFTDCLTRTGCASHLLHHDAHAKLLVLAYLEGSLVQGSAAEWAADTYVQAGQLARVLHGQAHRVDSTWDRNAVAKSIAWLDKPQGIPRDTVTRLRALLGAHVPQPVTVVPTHGDWHPRNWLIEHGSVRVIDFGRFAWRPATSDFCRLAAQQWRRDPQLEAAFFAGYGGDPRTPEQWRMLVLHEAIGTAAWAHQVGDTPFERQGQRMIAEALTLF